MTPELTGGCQCGAVAYRLSGPAVVYACHCRECQTQSGSAFALSLPVPRDRVEVSGPLAEWQRPADSGAVSRCCFCPRCGTRIYHSSTSSPDWMTLKAGTLHDTSALVAEAHIWVRSKQPWVRLDAAVPAFATQPANLALWRRQLVRENRYG